ncbi:MAG: hypothetical protein L3J37_04835 [Rhodobacteraceae bacterium]|nr:hypothetical protein [Paracoccaceae bacterium]
MRLATLLFALFPMVAQGQSDTPPVNTRISDVVSAVGPGWNASAFYKAILLRERDFVSLLIFQDPFDDIPEVYAPEIAFTGILRGMVPWLEFAEDGALLLRSENRAIGRNKWERTLTIIERDNRFIISAFSLSSYDFLDLRKYTNCTIDMLAGTMQVNEKPVSPFPLPNEILLVDWSEAHENLCYVEKSD